MQTKTNNVIVLSGRITRPEQVPILVLFDRAIAAAKRERDLSMRA